MITLRLSASALVVASTLAIATGAAHAQSAGCTLEQIADSSRQRLNCAGDISIDVEAGADYTLIDKNSDGTLDGVKLDGKALLLEVPPQAIAAGFEVIAPQAIAAVRGTRWVVDAQADKTSVFVVNGSVAVRPASGADAVTLGPGDGVDVGTGTEALTVKRWPAARVTALMARFGI